MRRGGGFEMAAAVKPGDVIEIKMPAGTAYAQVTHEHEEFGYLIRALPQPPEKGEGS
jgi:hypothetical protein